MTPLCQLEMTLPGGFPGGVGGDSSADERWGAVARLEVLRNLDRKRLSTQAAAQLLGLERRHVFRLLKAYRTEGVRQLVAALIIRKATQHRPFGRETLRVALVRVSLDRVLLCGNQYCKSSFWADVSLWMLNPRGALLQDQARKW